MEAKPSFQRRRRDAHQHRPRDRRDLVAAFGDVDAFKAPASTSRARDPQVEAHAGVARTGLPGAEPREVSRSARS